ncbi:MAG: HlyD family efflux transporter periplasmic adaptor subunit [Rhodocyclaceae bacterium]|nr:HlyD family efflux transporter periplasmic adaptor subunit [Rhodocyclaceae bacterium]MBX3669356.1 HlyD family efflux transporter periplasmic adaptor subunit [Rhodocyclaceae bacterium]
MLLIAIAPAACRQAEPPAWQGYAEGEYVRVAVAYAGRLDNLAVARGQQVAAGALLFELEHAAEQAALEEARARAQSSRARLANLEAGRRAPERAAIAAQVAAAGAALNLSSEQLRQQQDLYARRYVAKSRLDEAQAAVARDRAKLKEAEAQLANAGLSLGRGAEIEAASLDAAAAEQAVAQAAWRLEQKRAVAPAAGLVQDTYFVAGEWVPAGTPIVSLLPPGNIKLRFFVAEGEISALKPGAAVEASCDACGAPIRATVSYVAPQPEYTPPVIYSKESRAKLVFLVEARPAAADAARLKPGQPLDVRAAPGKP